MIPHFDRTITDRLYLTTANLNIRLTLQTGQV